MPTGSKAKRKLAHLVAFLAPVCARSPFRDKCKDEGENDVCLSVVRRNARSRTSSIARRSAEKPGRTIQGCTILRLPECRWRRIAAPSAAARADAATSAMFAELEPELSLPRVKPAQRRSHWLTLICVSGSGGGVALGSRRARATISSEPKG